MKHNIFSDLSPKKKSKYGNIKTKYNSVVYDSKAEAEFAEALDLNTDIIGWARQVPFPVYINDVLICTYVADFVILKRALIPGANPIKEVIDVKGFKTDVYKLKKKMVEAQYGITIIEIINGFRRLPKTNRVRK